LIDPDLDPAIVYRYLREMAEEGLLQSEWQTEGGGVPRRIYRLTPAGEEFVRGCIVHLRCTRRRLGRILRMYREQFPEGRR
jgi:DNA-binding PadR family transcriptional regulator